MSPPSRGYAATPTSGRLAVCAPMRRRTGMPSGGWMRCLLGRCRGRMGEGLRVRGESRKAALRHALPLPRSALTLVHSRRWGRGRRSTAVPRASPTRANGSTSAVLRRFRAPTSNVVELATITYAFQSAPTPTLRCDKVDQITQIDVISFQSAPTPTLRCDCVAEIKAEVARLFQSAPTPTLRCDSTATQARSPSPGGTRVAALANHL